MPKLCRPSHRPLALLSLMALASSCSNASEGSGRATATDRPSSTPPSGIGGGSAGSPSGAATAGIAPVDLSASLPGSSGLPANVCESVNLVATELIPEMMIVLDRSGSMETGGRWQPSVSAVEGISKALETKIDFGLTLFPNADAVDEAFTDSFSDFADCFSAPDPQACLDAAFGSGVNVDVSNGGPACAPGEIAVPVASNNAQSITQVLRRTAPRGGTPTSGTLEGLLDSYASDLPGPDEVPQPKYVLLVTDGEPTCPAGQGSDPNPADIAASNQAIEALANVDVKTYVIGYDTSGAGNEDLARVLDGFAVRGGTGDSQHRPVEDEGSLIDELQRILGEVTSCSLFLEDEPSSPDFVLVTLDSRQLNLNDSDGWRLVDGRTVELVGEACEKFKSGVHRVEATVECDIVVPQ